jgi:class 3 adenylate cyclase
VCGGGPVDVVYVPNWASPIDLIWDHPLPARFLTRLASFARLILFDKRGSGSSDHVSVDALATLEDWTEDITTVMDAVGSRRAALIGVLGGCPIVLFFAATYPDRASSLVLFNPTTRTAAGVADAADRPDAVEARVTAVQRMWGTSEVVGLFAPTMSGDKAFTSWFTRFCRVGNPPAMAVEAFRASLLSDVRATLPLIQSPTLVVQRADASTASSRAQGGFIAERIDGARYLEMPGADLIPYVGEDTPVLLNAIETFVSGDRVAVSDRVLATVLFTDIVASTEHAARMGDRDWHALLDEHDVLVQGELDRYQGRKVNSTGDGMLATFDGPARAVRCAQAICSSVRALGVELRAGLHTGEVEVRGDDIGGIAVHIGARIAALAGPNEILVSRTIVDLTVGSGLDFAQHGNHQLKGIPGTWGTFVVQPTS